MNYDPDVVENVMAEFGNLQVAWDWVMANGDRQMALDMIVNLLFMGEMEGWYHFVVRVYETAAARLAPLVAPEYPNGGRRQTAAVMLGWIGFCCGNLFNHLGLLEKARKCVESNRALLRTMEPGNAREELQVLTEWLYSRVLYCEGEFGQSRRILCKLLTYFRESQVDFLVYGHTVGAKFWQAHALGALAHSAYMLGNYHEAKRRLDQAITLREQVGEVRYRAFNLSLFARVMLTTGDYVEAGRLARESLRLSQGCGDRIGVAVARLELGRVETAFGRYTLGQEHCRQSLAVGRQTGNHDLLMDALVQLGRIELALEKPDAARPFFEEAISAFVRLETAHSNKMAGPLLGLGWSALAKGDDATAKRLFQETLCARGRTAWETMDATAGLAQVAAREGRTLAAIELCTEVQQSTAAAHSTRLSVAQLLKQPHTLTVPV